MNYIKSLFLGMFICTLVFTGCTKEDNPNNTQATNDKSFWVEDGVLHVDNQTTLDSLENIVATFSDEQLVRWEDSLGYQSYSTFYKGIFREYEKMAEQVMKIESDEPYFDFRSIYNESVIFPDEEIQGETNRTMEPKVTIYTRLTNEQGLLKVGDNNIDNVSLPKLKSSKSFSCFKKTSSREMEVFVRMGPGVATSVQCYCRKKTIGWWSYNTNFNFYTNTHNPLQVFYLYSGTTVYPKGWNTTLLTVWSDGVGESNKCEFSY